MAVLLKPNQKYFTEALIVVSIDVLFARIISVCGLSAIFALVAGIDKIEGPVDKQNVYNEQNDHTRLCSSRAP
jgi:hypothetical protein